MANRNFRIALSLAAMLALASAGLAPAPALAAAPHRDTAPPLDNVLPDRPKPVTNLMGGSLRQAQPDAQQDPLTLLGKDMTVVVGDLTHQRTGQPVQVEQDQILQTMDVLIKQLEKQCNCNCQKPGSKSCANPSRPLPDSKIVGGPGGIGPLRPTADSRKAWGELPAKQREQILQSRTQGFPAGFESILQSYYFRLSTEQVGRDEGGASSGTSPGGGATAAQP